MKNTILNSSLIFVGVTVSLFLCDWVLGTLGYPTEFTGHISHPKNYEEVRRNIEFQYVFKTNSRGLRYRDVAVEKPATSHRIYVAGDSFTEGNGIEEGKRFTDLLEGQFQSGRKQHLVYQWRPVWNRPFTIRKVVHGDRIGVPTRRTAHLHIRE